jgi:leucyl aminopeptidase (aminopeptidase T)
MERGAKILIETCAGVRADEHVVIVTDTERELIARTIADAATSVGGVATVVVSPPRAQPHRREGCRNLNSSGGYSL